MAKDKDGAKAQLQALIDQLNDIRGYLATATARGLNGAESGALAGDAAIAAIKQDLDTITTSPLKGFAGGEVYLAEIGVKTNRDGSLSLDAAKLEEALESAPEKFQAVFESANSVAAGHMSLGLSSSAKPPVGAHDFVYDAGTDSATLNGVSLSSRTNSEGQREFYKLTGDFSGREISGQHVRENLLSLQIPTGIDPEEQDAIWEAAGADSAAFDDFSEPDFDEAPPRPEAYRAWFDYHENIDLRRHLRDIEVILIEAALSATEGMVSHAADRLNIGRTTLIEKMKKLMIEKSPEV
jgi:flagellar capping protein FliD